LAPAPLPASAIAPIAQVTVGVVKEIKAGERRVGLTPRGVGELTQNQVRVLVQRGAGLGSGFADAEFEAAGATLVDSAQHVFDGSDVVAHVKELQPSEYDMVKPWHLIYTYNHFEADRPSTERALASNATYVSYEKVFLGRRSPLLAPMSRIAGGLASLWAGYLSRHTTKAEGDVRIDDDGGAYAAALSQFPAAHDPRALEGKKVLVLGGGEAGYAAAKMARDLGARVAVTDSDPARREFLAAEGLDAVDSKDTAAVERLFLESDVHIGTVYVGGRAPIVMDEDLMRRLGARRPHHTPAIVIDISVDQGGNYAFVRRGPGGLEVSDAKTSHAKLAALDAFGNLIVRVPNMPAAVPRYASISLEEATLPYLLRIVSEGLHEGMTELYNAISIDGGRIRDPKVAETYPDLPR
jgi:alanine dehydrogenase